MKELKLSIIINIFFILFSKSYTESNISETTFSLNETNNDQNLEFISEEEEEKEEFIKDYVHNITSLKEFDAYLEKNNQPEKTCLFLFYSETCGHCKRFAPIYKKIALTLFEKDKNILLNRINVKLHDSILEKYPDLDIMGVPTVFIYRNEKFIRYDEENDYDVLLSFLNKLINYKCKEILSYAQFKNIFNDKTVYSLQNDKEFILGIFKYIPNSTQRNIISDNFILINADNFGLVNDNNCFYYFYNNEEKEKTSDDVNDLTDKYLEKLLTNNDNLIFSYNNQKGLNTFILFDNYMNLFMSQKNFIQTSEQSLVNVTNYSKHFKEFKITFNEKYKTFIEDNYLYKYYKANEKNFGFFVGMKKKMFIFSYNNITQENIFITEINKLLAIDNTLNKNYLFILNNISSINDETFNESYNQFGVSFIDNENFVDKTIIDDINQLNITSLNEKLNEFIEKDKANYFKEQSEKTKNVVKGVFDIAYNIMNFFSGDTKKNNKENNDEKNEISDDFNEEDQELIDEINKTIIEDELKQKEKIKEKSTEKKSKKKKVRKGQITTPIKYEDEDEIGFNKKFILFPLYLIIYSILYYLIYSKIIKCDKKSLYSKLPIFDDKTR